jgi:1-acyl-sn-glycerol-3-phosphate acyltransferase
MRSAKVTHPGPTLPYPLYWVGRGWMKFFGWSVEGSPPNVTKVILIAHPHTSNWDLAHMLAAAFVYRLRISWLGKNSIFKPPFGTVMKWLGGVPVDRSAPHGMVKQVVEAFERKEKLVLAVPPSGTRSKRDHWKSGFYWMACNAQVPIACGYLDYDRKVAGIGMVFQPSGDVHADMDKLRSYYEGIRGRFPERETTIRLKEEDNTP